MLAAEVSPLKLRVRLPRQSGRAMGEFAGLFATGVAGGKGHFFPRLHSQYA